MFPNNPLDDASGACPVDGRLMVATDYGCIRPHPDVRAYYMGWSGNDSGGGRRGYHHGNLREALIRAALELIEKKGPFGFTFADAARSAGVSSAAPYRHFRDRDALVADVARRGFELLAAELDRAWNGGKPDALSAFERIGRAYLGFARDTPAYYSAMFEAGLPLEEDVDLRDAADRAIAPLREAAEALCAQLPATNRPPARMMSLHIWSLSHGIAALFSRGDPGRRKLPMSPEELLEAAVLIYLQGLGFRGGVAPGGLAKDG